MSKKAEMPQTRRHVLIFDEDWDWLEANYGRYSQSRIGTGVAIRRLLHHQVRALKQQVQERLDARQGRTLGDGEESEQYEVMEEAAP